MSTILVFVLSLLTLLSLAYAQGRAPHGLVYENPTALSPEAFDFFHPNTQQPNSQSTPCVESDCAPIPQSATFSSVSAVAQSTEAHENNLSDTKTTGSRLSAGGIAGIVFGFAFAVLLAMGVYYVAITRRSNITQANSVRPDA
ncbi:uncharacterized protein LOC122086261 [Macadamia integrifolia]|uniref:uncharacterized protein LOC122086261 n=1 Tax=Macadamia integrifolia TaxID=60698 RepID=UPI001C4F6DD3|nr:uncharacterized protein LOC122086261 [Macadamia integrifolia]